MAERPALMTYDQKLERVLGRATAVFAEKGSEQQLLFSIPDHSHNAMLENCLVALEGAKDPRDKLARLFRSHPESALEDMDHIQAPDHEIGESPEGTGALHLEDRVSGFALGFL
jgi:hypothetical protein